MSLQAAGEFICATLHNLLVKPGHGDLGIMCALDDQRGIWSQETCGLQVNMCMKQATRLQMHMAAP